ncbi:hemicentin-1-like isoform X5 [Saccostrea cucullata]|uniref:hemicentin-1-like isoform X5 n=1 Tax=Saccostrea cuccullata TaxID=36930 RepID=UPI002ED1CC4C
MACDIKTFALRQGSFLIPVLLIILLFNGIYSQTIPGNPTIVGDFEKNEGETATLSCTSVGGNPLPTVEWYKNNQLVDPGSSSTGNGDGVYTIGSTSVTYNNYTFTVSRSDNLVSYICRVKNSVLSNNLTRSWTISVYVQTQQPVITGPEPAITNALDAGSTYKYVCSASNGRPAPQILWKLGTSLSTAVEFHQGISESTITNADSTLTKTSNLSWVPITDDNGKNLYCETVQTTAGGSSTRKSTFVPINVQQTPLLQVGSAFYTTQVGGSVTLACTVLAATPAVTDVFWSRLVNGVYTRISIDNIRFFGATTSNANLTINSVALTDATSYRCSATNAAGTGTSSATTLSVSGSAPLVQIDQDKYPSTSGNTVTLVCDVYSSLSVSRVYWEREVGGQFTAIDVAGNPSKYGGVTISSPSLVVKSVTTSDAGRYRCVAINIAGTGQDTTVLEIQGNLPRVTIEKDSYSVNEGNAVTLACTVLSSTSTNIIDVSWQTIENGVSRTLNVNDPSKYAGASISNPSLTIFNAEISDNGQYRCTATNTVGTGESAITTLKVIAKPSFRISQSSYSVNYGSNVTLQVTISSPDAQILAINWQHTTKAGITNYILTGGGRYSGAIIGSPSLRISSVTFSDEGTYRCLVTSSAGSTTSGPISLTVIGTVPSVVIGSGSAIVFGGNVSISCSISSNPIEQSVSWQKTVNGATTTLNIIGNPRYEGGTLSNPSLTIYNVNLGDSGEYRCLATNIVGTGQSGPAMIDVTGGVPAVTIGSGSTVYVGDDVTISCFVSGTPAVTSVSWEQTINSTTTAVNVNDLTKYSGGTVATPSLTIKNVNKANEGSYRCRATNLIGTGQSVTSAFISVIGGLPVTLIGPDVSVTVGNQATITCSVSGYPLSTSIAWHKIANGVRTEIDTSQTRFSGGTISTPSLTISPVESSDEGDYQCTATNILGTSPSGTAYLDVLGSIPSVEIPSFSYTVAFGSQIRLQCVVNSIPPATSIRWLKTYQGVTSAVTLNPSKYSGGTISDPSLRIFNAELSDEATYVCSATNIVGTGTSREMTLSVVVSLPTVQVGSSAYTGINGGSVTLVCSIISSNPTATSVIWEKDINGNPTSVQSFMGTRVSGGTVSQPSLTISSLTGGDTGTYYCSARNSVGTGSRSTTTLTVQNRPTITLPQSTYNINFGQDVTLVCNVTSDTTLTSVVWRKYNNGVPTNMVVTGLSRYSGGTTQTPSLTIRALVFNDSGIYDCSATNFAGTSVSGQITLNVRGTVPSVNIPQTSYSVTYGGSITLQCIVNSNPFQSEVEWQRIASGVSTTINVASEPRYSGSSPNTPSLTITGAVSGDAGVYVCSATNDAGKGVSGQTVLSVIGNVPSISVTQTSYSVFVGSSVTLTCSVSGNPPVTNVFWTVTRNGVTQNVVTSGGSRFSNGNSNIPSLTLTNAQLGDSGTFICKAQNSAGTSESSGITLTVSGDVPSVSVAQLSYSVVMNGDVTMTCSVSANPAATIRWIFTANSGGTTTISSSTSKYTFSSSTSSSSLTVRTANSNDQGSYACSATNSVGTRQATATLTVTGNYPSVNMQSTYSVITGSSINMICSVSANPVVTSITWQFQAASSNSFVSISSSSKYGISGTSGSSSTLTVNTAASSDQGLYRCLATNQVGTRSANTTLTVSGSLPSVNIPLNSYSAVTGQDMTIPCSVSASPTASITWTFISTSQSQTQISVSTTKYTFNPSSTDGTLIVRSTTSSDSGTYRCQATNSVGTTSDVATLSVTGSAPSVSFGSQSYTVITGNNVQLSCFVSATPAATGITWTFQSTGGGSLTITPSTSGYSIVTASSQTQSTLTVLSAENNDAGTYTCTATNTVGTRSASVSLSVSGSLPVVNIPQNSYSAITGQDVTISCSVSANPAATITWTFISTSQIQTQITTSTSKYTFNPSSTNGNLIVRSTTTSDSGTYRCGATNAVGTVSDVATLSVTGSLPVVTIPQNSYSAVTGQDATIPCSVSANPAATITWTFISTSQSQTQITTSTSKYTFNPSSTNGNLIVRSTTSSDIGTYRCQATNAVGTSSDVATLSVTGSAPSVNFGSSSYSVVTGNNVQLSCFVSATPAATGITWTFQSTGGGSLTITPSTSGYSIVTSSSQTQSTLTVLSAQNNDAGTYTCTATNTVGTRSASATLSVSGSLPAVNIPQNSYSAVTGQDVTIPCSVSANPTATISWTFISTSQSQTQITTSTSKYTFSPSSTNGNLIVRSTTTSDSGTYRCGATNAVGTTSDSATLSVSGSLPTVTIPQTTYTAIIGSNQQIVCFVNANPTASSIEWTFRSSTSGSTITITSSTPGYSIATASTSQSTLTVQGVDNGDEGTYTCRATNQVGQGADSAFLDVTGNLPTVNIQQNTYTSVSGQDVTISCVVSANPSATISWTFISTNNAQVQITTSTADYSVTTSSTGSTLVVRTTNSGDSGTYRCTATNSIGTASDSATLTVSGSLPTVNIPNNVYTAIQGQDATIPCSVSANPAATSFSWTFISSTNSQTQITQSTTKYTLSSSSTDRTLIVRGTTSADGGTYRCSATNAEGTASDQATLSVTGSRPVVDITQTSYSAVTGSNVVIPCTVSASPAATSVQWKFTSGSGSEVTISASSSKYTLSNSLNFPQLTILSVSSSDSGTYQCSATNAVGTGSDTTSLSVTGSRPVVSITSSTYNVIIGNAVTIPCTISATPSATSVSWFFTSNSNNRIQITTSSVKYTVSTGGSYYNLTVNSAASSDAGVYECRATNVIDTSTDSARLAVSGSIPVVSLPTTTYRITYGQNVTLQCSISATPAITSVQWEKFVNSGYQSVSTLSPNKYYGGNTTVYDLTIVNLVFGDAGSYRCTATNQVGRGVSPNTATLQVLGDKPSVFVQQSSYSAVIGTNVSLACTVSVTTNDPPVLNVYWKKTTPSGSGTIDVSGSSKYSGSTIESPNLIISNLDVHDNGNYSCLATNAAGTSESGVAILTVTGSQPAPNIPLGSYSVLIGNDIQIPCSVSADPPVTSVEWTFRPTSGNTITIAQSNTKYTLASGTSNPNLTINSAALTDAGTYTCKATNIVGPGEDSATLTITGIIPNVTIPDTSLSIQKRQNITITCVITEALPKETSVLWEFRANQGDSGTIISIASNPTKYQGGTVAVPSLTILSVAASDQGYYTCIASNVFGEGRSEQAFLEATGNAATVTVSPSSQSVLQKSTAVISCTISNANPAVTEVTWEKVSSGVTTSITVTGRFNGSTPSVPDLTISNLEPGDAGTYYCSARNAIGTTRSNTGSVLIVTGAVPSSVLIAGSSNRNVNLGGALTLQCSGQGQPSPTYTWLFSSSTTTSTVVGTGNTYTITNALRTNAGTYICRATNTLGTLDSPGVTVNVQYAPVDARTEAQKIVTATVDTAVTLSCNVDANPTASFQWYRNSQLVGSQQTYTFTFSGTDTQGVYTCRATNSVGSQDLQFTVSQGTGNVGASTATSGLSTGEIAAIILALLLLLLLIIIIIICCLTHGVCGAICGKKQDVKGRVEPTEEKEVYKETQKEVIIPRFHEESIKGKSYREPARAGSYRSYPAHANKYRQPSAVSRKDVDVRVQNGGFRKENDYEIVRYETVPPVSTQLMTESPRPHRLPALSYTYEDVEKKRKRRKKKKHHRRRHHDHGEEVEVVRSASPTRYVTEPSNEMVVERVIRSRSASPTRIIRTEAEEPTVVERVIRSSSPSRHVYRQEVEEPVEYSPSPGRRGYGYYDNERIIETTRSSRSPRRHRHQEEEDVIIERRSPSTKRRYEENYITDDRDIIQEDGDLRAYNGVVYREAPSRHGSGRYAVQSSERRSRSRGRHGSDDDVEVVYGKEYVVER